MIWYYALYVLLGIVVLLLVSLGIAAIRTLFLPKAPALGRPPEVDSAKAKVYAESLSQLIQCETVNQRDTDPKELEEKFSCFRKVLKELYPTIHETLELTLFGDAMLFHWQGKDSDKDAIVLMAHSDVVPVEGDWKYPPFGGTIAQGAVWGRGAMDNKGAMCCLFTAVEELLQEGFIPPCDVYLVSSNNEETMGDGALRIADHLVEQGVSIALTVDEGGVVAESPLPGLEGHFSVVGILEKGYGDVKFTAKSKGGHSSTPPSDTPLARLAAFMVHMDKEPPFPNKLTQPVKEMFETLAPYMSFPIRMVLSNLWLFSPLLTVILPKVSPMTAAMLRTTCVFTMAEGSSTPNVIPGEASVVANLRYMTHQKEKESLAAIQRVANKYDLEMEVLNTFDCSPTVDTETEMFQYVKHCIQTTFPDAGYSPYVMMGGTDAKYFAHLSPCTIRFAPLVLSPSQLGAMHAVNENLDVDALPRGVTFYRNLLKNYKG